MNLAKNSIMRASVLLATLASAASLQAVNVDFDFNGSSALTLSKTFNSIPAGISVNVTGWGRVGLTGVFSPALVGQYAGGLGVTSSANDGHTVDNGGGLNDYLVFQFSQSVTVNSVTIGFVGESSNGFVDSDFTYFIGNSQASLLSTAAGIDVNGGSIAPVVYNINAGNLAGTFLAIAAFPASTANDDGFKVRNLNVDFTRNVPDSGSTMMLLGAGLLGLAVIRRKSRA